MDWLPTSAVAAVSLATLWLAEAIAPMFGGVGARHRLRNIALGGLNALVSITLLSALTLWATALARTHAWGFFHNFEVSHFAQGALALVLLDLWHYGFHIASHKAPWLWRLHTVHHHDEHVEATTAMRFHAGEIIILAVCTVPIIFMLGLEVWHLLLHQLVLLPVALFHHADIRLPAPLDRALRLVIVTPRMHWVHHSSWQPETDSNYSAIFSWWDRIFGTYRRRSQPTRIRFGLEGFDQRDTATLRGILSTPFGPVKSTNGTRPRDPDLEVPTGPPERPKLATHHRQPRVQPS